MPRIVFRGKTYYSVYEMPPNVRRAYEKEKKRANVETTKEEVTPVADPSLYDPKAGTESIMRGLIWGILVALILSGIAFLLVRFLF
jgi:hypothetical protein